MRTFISHNLLDPVVATGVVALLMLLSLFVAGYTNERRTTSGAPIIILATATPQAATPRAVPVLADVGPHLERAIIAYDAPAGAVIGAIEPGRAYLVIAVSGDWLQLDIDGSGVVWTPGASFYGVTSIVPTASPEPPVVVWTPAEQDQEPAPHIIISEVKDEHGHIKLVPSFRQP